MTTTKRTVVAGYDGSAASLAAVRHALAKDDIIVVVHAYEVPPQHAGAPYYQEFLDTTIDHANAVMRSLEERCPELVAAGYEPDVIEGPPAAAIVRAAEARDADLIVLGSRGAGRIRAAVVGSVAHETIHLASCPVLVIPERMVAED